MVIIISCIGKRLNYEVSRNKCFTCEKNKNRGKKVDKYTRVLIKMYGNEEKELGEEKSKKKRKKDWKKIEKIERN